jgi:hypothetical protein
MGEAGSRRGRVEGSDAARGCGVRLSGVVVGETMSGLGSR